MKNSIEKDFVQLLILNTFLESHSNEKYKNLNKTKISDLPNLEKFNNFEEIKNKEIWHRFFQQKDYDVDLLSLVDNSKRNLFRLLSSWVLIICFIALLIIPILLSNYWLYFFFLILPLSALASGSVPTIFKPIFWIVIIGISAFAIYSRNYDLLIMITPILIMKYSASKSRKVFINSILKAAKKNEIFFKFLYVSGNISVYDRISDELHNI